ncbi:hypothetical protein, partial [Endozoicomonas sp. ONNA1]|uniref:hypothetical protein n=1 Tax=Endozoicomonas sp. ONNA1 TaxID=2828740 RepID=UPI0021475B8D
MSHEQVSHYRRCGPLRDISFDELENPNALEGRMSENCYCFSFFHKTKTPADHSTGVLLYSMPG